MNNRSVDDRLASIKVSIWYSSLLPHCLGPLLLTTTGTPLVFRFNCDVWETMLDFAVGTLMLVAFFYGQFIVLRYPHRLHGTQYA